MQNYTNRRPSGHLRGAKIINHKPQLIGIPTNIIKAIFCIFSILLLSDSFWDFVGLLFELPVDFSESVTVQIFKAGVCAIGFVALAIHWERALQGLLSMWFFLFPIVLAYCSVVWSLSATTSLQSSIMLLLGFIFALGLALEVSARFMAQACAIAALILIILQIGGQFVFDEAVHNEIGRGDLGFALVASVWALQISKKWRLLWAAIAIFSLIIIFATKDIGGAGAIIGLVAAFLINLGLRRRQSNYMQIAWITVVLLMATTLFVAFRWSVLAHSLRNILDQLGNRWVYGMGYGIAGQDIYAQFGMGLGMLGVLAALLSLIGCFTSALLNARFSNALLWPIFGLGFSLLFSGSGFAVISPIPLILVAACYRTSLAQFRKPSF